MPGQSFRLLLWPFLVVVVFIGGWLIVQNWDWLSNDVWNWLGAAPNEEARQETNSTTLRNIGLVVAGLIALPLAVWRSIVAQRQADTAQQGLRNDRYQKGAEMLGNDVLSVRLGGIYALQSLAEEHPKQYHVQILRLFCAFARRPTKDPNLKIEPKADESRPPGVEDEAQMSTTQVVPGPLREDVKAVMKAICGRTRASIALEREAQFRLDLAHADLAGMISRRADLSGASLTGANLSGAWLIDANLSCAYLMHANLSGAGLIGTNLSGTYLHGMKNLTQLQLDEARADSKNPPKLEGTVDAVTGMPLVWRGKPLDDEAEPSIGY